MKKRRKPGERTVSFRGDNGDILYQGLPVIDATKSVAFTLAPDDFKGARRNCPFLCGLSQGALVDHVNRNNLSLWPGKAQFSFVRRTSFYVVSVVKGKLIALRYKLLGKNYKMVAEWDTFGKIPKQPIPVTASAPTGVRRLGKHLDGTGTPGGSHYKGSQGVMRGSYRNPATGKTQKYVYDAVPE